MGLERWQRIEELYRSALERGLPDRRAFLALACQGDEDLHREVELLLGQHVSGKGMPVPEAATEEFVGASDKRLWANAAVGPDRSSVPDRISHYRIIRKLGEGGMGIVYAARDERLGRSVAIKMIRGAGESGQARPRFWQEARSLARVNHPRICQIFEVDEEAGILFLVLELLEGRSLEDRLKAEPTPFHEALRIAHEILEALEALHGLNIVHRDLKPSNVFLTQHGVKLLDFGLAHRVNATVASDEDATPTATVLTAPGAILGTPHYMAPEQIDGPPAGPPADLFAAGCLLYEMIAGHRAFEGNSFIDVLYQVKHSEPPRLGGSPTISAVDTVIRRSIEKRPEDRYQSAKEMAEALRSIDLPPGPEPQPQSRPVIRFIALPFRLLRRDDDTDFLASSLPDAISSSLSGIDSLIVRSSLLAARFDSSDPKKIAAEADVDIILIGTLLRAGENIRVASQLVEAPSGTLIWSDTADFPLVDIFQLQDNLTNRIVQSLMLPLTDRERSNLRHDVPANAKAYECYLRANQIVLHRTTDNVKLARDIYLQCLQEDPTYAPAWARLGRVYRLIEKFGEESEEIRQLADAAYRRAFALNPDLAVAHNLYTSVEADLGRAQHAMVRLLGRAKLKRHDPELFTGLVQACRYCGELRASVAAHQRAVRLDPRISTSIPHTHFLLCDYQKILDGVAPEKGFYLDAAALACSGREREALTRLREREKPGVGGPHGLMRSLRAILEGDCAGAIRTIDEYEASGTRDPESFFYVARHLVRLNEHGRAIATLFRVIDQDFICDFSLAHDSWLDPLRSHARYGELTHKAGERRRQTHVAFVEAGGELLLRPDSLTAV